MVRSALIAVILVENKAQLAIFREFRRLHCEELLALVYIHEPAIQLVSAEDLSGGFNDSEASALVYWPREVAEPNIWWVCRPKGGGRGVVLETVKKRNATRPAHHQRMPSGQG